MVSRSSEDERVVSEFTANNDKIVQGLSWFWLLTNSDEVNLNSQKIEKKVDKLNAGSFWLSKIGEEAAAAEFKTCYRKETG